MNQITFSNLLLILSVNNRTHMYLSDLRVYFKVEVYLQKNEVGWRSTKITSLRSKRLRASSSRKLEQEQKKE